MRFRGILLDIDNTLYDYQKAHRASLDVMLDRCSILFDISKDELLEKFSTAKKYVHISLSETASSHNRLLYIQKMLEIIGDNSFFHSLELYELYWRTFLNHMEVYDGVYDFLGKNKNSVICMVTDLTAHIQHRKVKKLFLDKYADLMVTSEEAGKEKPHPYIFMLALQKMGLGTSDVCLIGDNFKKDIIGATNLGIRSFWFNQSETERELPELATSFKSFRELGSYI